MSIGNPSSRSLSVAASSAAILSSTSLMLSSMYSQRELVSPKSSQERAATAAKNESAIPRAVWYVCGFVLIVVCF